MDKINDGGPAFPAELSNSGPQGGMTLRDYFAGQMMAALVSDREVVAHLPAAARIAYQMADALIAARSGE